MISSRAPTFFALLAAGALLPLALAPFSLWPIAIVSTAVLFWFLHNNSPKQTLINATVFGFGLFFAGVSWVYISMHDHGDVAAPVALLGTILFCLFLALLFAVPFILSAFIPQTPIALSIGLPAIWVLSEWFRGWVFTGFPWLYAGYAHTDTWPNGWAPIGGVLWLSYINALAATAVVQLLRNVHHQTQLVAALVVALWVMGYGLQKVDWTQSSGAELSVVLVQPNIHQEDKWAPAERDNILQRLASQTEAHWGADIILWPEGAIPALPRQVTDYLIDIDNRAKVNQTSLLIGIPTEDWRSRRYYNSMLALGDSRGQYDKTRLVPFGEYVPLENVLRGLNRFFDLPMSSFSLGSANQPLLSVKNELIAPAICYEIAYPNLVADRASEAGLLLTVSNDAWFGHSMAPQQHMQMARMRAIENRKPLMRGTNNGVTALVNYRGEVDQQLEQYSAGELSGTVSPRVGQTAFTRVGSWPTVLLSMVICLSLVVKRWLTNKEDE